VKMSSIMIRVNKQTSLEKCGHIKFAKGVN